MQRRQKLHSMAGPSELPNMGRVGAKGELEMEQQWRQGSNVGRIRESAWAQECGAGLARQESTVPFLVSHCSDCLVKTAEISRFW